MVDFIIPKGTFLGAGVSGMVELLNTGLVTKSPWPGERAEESHADLQLEAKVHLRLQMRLKTAEYIRRFVPLISCDSDSTLTMEYMENGTLRDYLRAHPDVGRSQRLAWIFAMTEGLKLLHAHHIIHCDLTPTNMLLDHSLELKIADFGCSSLDDSPSTGAAGVRFRPCWDWRKPATQDDDLFALGSCMYEVLTGRSPFGDIASDQVRNLHVLCQFADLTGMEMADVIRDCWLAKACSAEAIYDRLSQRYRSCSGDTVTSRDATEMHSDV